MNYLIANNLEKSLNRRYIPMDNISDTFSRCFSFYLKEYYLSVSSDN